MKDSTQANLEYLQVYWGQLSSSLTDPKEPEGSLVRTRQKESLELSDLRREGGKAKVCVRGWMCQRMTSSDSGAEAGESLQVQGQLRLHRVPRLLEPQSEVSSQNK